MTSAWAFSPSTVLPNCLLQGGPGWLEQTPSHPYWVPGSLVLYSVLTQPFSSSVAHDSIQVAYNLPGGPRADPKDLREAAEDAQTQRQVDRKESSWSGLRTLYMLPCFSVRGVMWYAGHGVLMTVCLCRRADPRQIRVVTTLGGSVWWERWQGHCPVLGAAPSQPISPGCRRGSLRPCAPREKSRQNHAESSCYQTCNVNGNATRMTQTSRFGEAEENGSHTSLNARDAGLGEWTERNT